MSPCPPHSEFMLLPQAVKFRAFLSKSSPLISDETLLTNVACGILSGVISSSIANPTDVLKVCQHACLCLFCTPSGSDSFLNLQGGLWCSPPGVSSPQGEDVDGFFYSSPGGERDPSVDIYRGSYLQSLT